MQGARTTVERTTNAARWAAACRASGQPISPFHSYAWLDLAASMTKTVFTALVVRSDGSDVGVAPWLSRSRGPVSTVNWMPFPYVGPLVPPETLDATLRRLRWRALRERAVVQQFQFGPGTRLSEPPGGSSPFQARQDFTWLIDTTQTEDALWAKLDKTSRKKIRHLEREGVYIDSCRDGGAILARVLEGVFARRNLRSPYPSNFPPALAELNRGGLQAHWSVAVKDEVEIGSLLTLMFDGIAVAWVGGVLPEHQATNANVLLYWEMIQWACAQGARSLDLVGIPDPGIDRFKSQFGGSRVGYTVLTKWAPGVERIRAVQASRGGQRHLANPAVSDHG
jgi:CelD/BcsL family acetyltransferase involved in cellulose biosynthesis